MVLWYNFGDISDFEYEVDSEDVSEALSEILEDLDKDELIDLIRDHDGVKLDLEEYFKGELYYYFEAAARDAYEDSKLYRDDPLGFYGMHIVEFL